MGKNSKIEKAVKFSDLSNKEVNIYYPGNSNYDYYGNYLKRKGFVKLNSMNKIEQTLIVRATVTDRTYSYHSSGDFEVEVQAKNGKLISYSCSCNDFKSTFGICEHIAATVSEIKEPINENKYINDPEGLKKFTEAKELAMLEELKQNIVKYKYTECKQMLYTSNVKKNKLDLEKIYDEAISNSVSAQRENIDIIPIIDFNGNSIDVSFRVGSTKKIIVKNLTEFYNHSKNNRVMPLSTKVSIEVKKENFTDPVLYDYMIQIGKKKVILGSNVSSNGSESLYGEQIDEFLSLIKDKQFYIKGDLNRLITASLAPKQINYSLEKKDYNLVIDTSDNLDFAIKSGVVKNDTEKSDDLPMYKKRYLAPQKSEIMLLSDFDLKTYSRPYFYSNKYYYIIEDDQLKTIKLDDSYVIQNLLKARKIVIDPKDYSKFVSKIASKIPDLQNKIEDESLAKSYPLNAQMKIDENEFGKICLDLYFVYGDKKFQVLDPNALPLPNADLNSFLNTNVDPSIIRDFDSEQDVIKQLFDSKFEIIFNQFVLSGNENIYNFLVYDIKDYMQKYEVLATEKFLNKKVVKPQLKQVGLRVNNGLLELDLSSLNFDVQELENILSKYREKKKFYKLKDGNYLNLEDTEQLETLDEMINNLDINLSKVEDDKVLVEKNRAMYLESIFEKSNISVTKDKEIVEILDNFENFENVQLDENFTNVLRPYQVYGVNWLKSLEKFNFGGILADDMGLGKSLQVISLLSTTKDKAIIVCPSTLVLNWMEEIQKWGLNKKILNISGPASQRREQIQTINYYDIIITSYDLLKRDIDLYSPYEFKYIIADEAQYFKNLTTQVAKCVKQLKGTNRFALTGTPIENSVAELWSIFDFIMPGYLYNYATFKRKFEKPIILENNEEQLKRLKKLISPFILRRIKEDVLTELPDKNISIIKNEMTEEQQKIYNTYFLKTQKELAQVLDSSSFEKSKFKILSLLIRLRQLCNHPSLFLEDYTGGSGKLEQCMDLIKDAINGNHKILLFSSHPSMFPYIEEKLSQEDIKYYTLTGKTKINERVAMVNDFNENDDIKVFLISLKAGGTGLNLTSADVVIHFDPWWNLSAENQATDRAYRIGQKNAVSVYKLITKNTIEEKINKMQERKAQLSENILNTEQKLVSKMTKEEILDLFK